MCLGVFRIALMLKLLSQQRFLFLVAADNRCGKYPTDIRVDP
jgi:hypothetical protein